MGKPGDGFELHPDSVNHNANVLLELAGALEAGRLDHEMATQGCAPRSHADVGDEVRGMTSFVTDQYRDGVALLAALSTKLAAAGEQHVTVDDAERSRLDHFLSSSRFVPPHHG